VKQKLKRKGENRGGFCSFRKDREHSIGSRFIGIGVQRKFRVSVSDQKHFLRAIGMGGWKGSEHLIDV